MSDPDVREPPRPLGEFRADALELNRRRAELTRLYPDRFVIFYDGEVIGEASDLDTLDRLLNVQGLGDVDPVVEFLHSKHVTMRLTRT